MPNRKARFRARIALPAVAALCAIFFLLSADYELAIAYVLGGLLWFWLFGYYQTWFRHRHFARHVKDNNAENFGDANAESDRSEDYEMFTDLIGKLIDATLWGKDEISFFY